jgi:Na+/H+ antiporter NhaC
MVMTTRYRFGAAIASLTLIATLPYKEAIAQLTAVPAFSIEAGDIGITDNGTGYTDVDTMFNGEAFIINVGLTWNSLDVPAGANLTTVYGVQWTSFVDDMEVGSGVETFDLAIDQPQSMEAGLATVNESGSHAVRVVLQVAGEGAESESESDRSYQSFASGASFIPLLVILFLAMTTHEVYLSLGFGVFVGACMVAGNVKDGFKSTLDVYILGALADVDHGYVYLFTLFMSGFVGLLEKSGGIIGFTRWISRFATTPRAGQTASFITGLVIFFDDYANILIAGPSMRPMFHSLMMSAEKLAFVVDATAAPVASLTPVSSWVGFEVSLIQAEIDKLNTLYPDGLSITNSGFGVFIETIAYRYYPIFMLFLIPLLIIPQRDIGPMLVAERKTRVYGRKDGGEGSIYSIDLPENQGGNGGASNAPKSKNAPCEDTPLHPINFLIPVAVLIFYVFYFLIRTGQDGSGTQSFMDIMQGSDSYSALLWGTMAAALTAQALYFIQYKKDGKFAWPTLGTFIPRTRCTKKYAVKDAPKVLMTWREGLDALLTGMTHVFLALVLLTLAWAFGAVTVAVGLDRFFSNLIVEGDLGAEWLPTISFIVSAFIAFATGSSWSTMTIMFPLLLVPTYIKSNGDPIIFYATTAGVLSGSVAGDHASPVSDTTVLSSMSTGCQLLAHVRTQAPIVLIVVTWSCLVGTIPVGLNSYSNGIAILMGFIMCTITSFLFCAPVFSPTARFDIFTELYMRFNKDSPLHQLKADTVRAFELGEPVKPPKIPDESLLDDNEEDLELMAEKKVGSPSDNEEDLELMAKKKMGSPSYNVSGKELEQAKVVGMGDDIHADDH